jgi:hypothetical protein
MCRSMKQETRGVHVMAVACVIVRLAARAPIPGIRYHLFWAFRQHGQGPTLSGNT